MIRSRRGRRRGGVDDDDGRVRLRFQSGLLLLVERDEGVALAGGLQRNRRVHGHEAHRHWTRRRRGWRAF